MDLGSIRSCDPPSKSSTKAFTVPTIPTATLCQGHQQTHPLSRLEQSLPQTSFRPGALSVDF